MTVQQSDVSIYLGCALDNKLKWTKHAELVVSKARKRLSILKRLTAVKWGCNRDTLNTTYKTYIQPVLNYCNEVLISASENVRKLLDTFHNQALRMITGGVKTTPVLAMQLLCDLQPFTNIIEKNAAILFNRLIRLPNNSFWRDYDSDGGRNLKTQKGLYSKCSLDLVLNVRKRDRSPTALHAIALETINTRFPQQEWLHIYTDGSLLDFAQGAGIGVFSHLFSFYLHAGPLTTHFDGEVEAIHIALQQLAVRLPPIERAVILSDSTSALQALSNYNENNCLRVQNCRELLGKIKRKDRLSMASRVARDKPWSTLCKFKSHGIPSSPRAAAVAKFRLLTGHDCLCAHLFRFNLVTSPICVLCDTGQDMTAAHLDECSALNDLNCIVKRKGKNAVQARKKLTDVYGEGVFNWFAKFRSGSFDVEDAPRSGRPVEADKDAIKALVDANRRITTREIGLRLNLQNSTVYDHLKGLGLSSKLDVWVPHVLTERIASQASRKGSVFETHHHWGRKMGCIQLQTQELLPDNTTINSEVYYHQLDKLNDALQQKRSELINRKGVVFHQDNARPHTSLVTRQKLLQLEWDTMPHPPYSPDLAPSVNYLFRSLQKFLDEYGDTGQLSVKGDIEDVSRELDNGGLRLYFLDETYRTLLLSTS
ncbi:mariner Mos1 transposase [Trichonephila clavipes]|uniref:Mariner Mos1 transposase n=1 Tax=Trichonephila clavipes TaxID=2585209 RepID=A0A8X6VXG0_TRICX|nr:mariner Mos1 transposase [Trichonephila clavipes]